MRETPVCTAADAIYKLAAGNLKYLNAENGSGDISRRIRMSTWAKGQSPYAIIVTCSDSRVIPENIFSAGIGELFVIRLAGNIIDDHQLGKHRVRCRPSGLSAGGGAGPYPLRCGGCRHQPGALRLYPLHHGRDQRRPSGTKQTPTRPAVSMSGTVCRRSKRACASITSRRKRACGSSVRCTTSRTAASNSCKELPSIAANGPFPDRERAVSSV